MALQRFFFDPVHLDVTLRLAMALAAGGLIGLERSYHGRPAGFRTHALVSLSTSLLMLLTAFGSHWFEGFAQGRIALDPTRMAQGIMTGIGFLGAGTIMREGFSVRGLTTAASLWITAAIGILVGAGFYFPALLATALTLGTLSVFRWIESMLPTRFYAHLHLRFARDGALTEPEMRRLLREHQFKIGHLSYRFNREADFLEYRLIVRSSRAGNAQRLIEALGRIESLKKFSIVPTVD